MLIVKRKLARASLPPPPFVSLPAPGGSFASALLRMTAKAHAWAALATVTTTVFADRA